MNFLERLCALSYSYNYHYNYNWDVSNADEAAFLAVFGWMMGFILIVVLLCLIPFYVFESIGLYTIAKRRGLKAPGLAWVPVANYYIIGGIGDDYQKRKTGKDAKLRVWMLVLAIIGFVLLVIAFTIFLSSVISLIMSEAFVNDIQYEDELAFGFALSMMASILPFIIAWFALVACLVLFYISLYRIYKAASPDMAVLFLVLSIFFSVIIPFVVFALRNKDDGLPIEDGLPATANDTPASLDSGMQNK
ncbi:MAG: hypothetical protein HFE77_00070 [Clostridiales bacterium]|nr:hypothetical protein [Clostridiales bacterium]